MEPSTRRCGTALVAAASTLLSLAACSSSGVKAQSVAPATPTPPTRTSSVATSSARTISTPSSTATNTTGFGTAQPAVGVFLRLSTAYNAALKNPSKSSPSAFNQFVAGQARAVFDQSLADEKRSGKAFRGTPPADRLIVKSSDLKNSVPSVTLEDCVLESTSDPWTEYVVATGRAVPTAAPAKVHPPYAATIKMFRPTAAGWVVTSYVLDATKTCWR